MNVGNARAAYEMNVGRINGMFSSSPSQGGRGSWVVPACDKNTFSFGNGGTGTVATNLAQNIDSTGWVSGVLVTRLWTQPVFGGSLVIKVFNSFVADDDPATLFTGSAAIATSTAITSATTGPFLDVIAFAAPIGPFLQVQAVYTNGGAAAGTATIAVTLVGRPA